MKITYTKVYSRRSAWSRYEVRVNGNLIGIVQNEKSGPYSNWHVVSTVAGRIAGSCDGTAGAPGTIANVSHATRKDAVTDLLTVNEVN